MVRQALYGRPSGIAGEAARRIPTGPDINWISVDQPDQLPNPYVTLPSAHPRPLPALLLLLFLCLRLRQLL